MKLHFYTEKTSRGWVGRCKEYPIMRYTPHKGSGRDAALSGIKRKVKAFLAEHPPSVKKTEKRKVTRVAFVVDTSGSMRHIIDEVRAALNSNIEAMKHQTRLNDQSTEVSVFSFNTIVTQVRFPIDGDLVLPIKEYELIPEGGTALFDAVIYASNELMRQPVPQDVDVSYLVMVLTDGEENNSKCTAFHLSNHLRTFQATDRWTFSFLLPFGSKYYFTRRFSEIPEGNVAEWEASKHGVRTYQVQNQVALGSYFNSRSLGQTSTKAFYQTDLSGLTQSTVKQNLDDLSSSLKCYVVDKETDIRSFVESKIGSYKPGSAFYQLTKDEKTVQPYKDLLVMKKGEKSVYGGPDARQVLGFPEGKTLKVSPGNHGAFDIFIQSNSLNRKLVRGTKVLVKP